MANYNITRAQSNITSAIVENYEPRQVGKTDEPPKTFVEKAVETVKTAFSAIPVHRPNSTSTSESTQPNISAPSIQRIVAEAKKPAKKFHIHKKETPQQKIDKAQVELKKFHELCIKNTNILSFEMNAGLDLVQTKLLQQFSSLNVDSLDERALRSFNKNLAIYSTAIKTTKSANKNLSKLIVYDDIGNIYSKIANGKAKVVWQQLNSSSLQKLNVYYTPTLPSKKAEMREEVAVSKTIEKKLLETTLLKLLIEKGHSNAKSTAAVLTNHFESVETCLEQVKTNVPKPISLLLTLEDAKQLKNIISNLNQSEIDNLNKIGKNLKLDFQIRSDNLINKDFTITTTLANDDGESALRNNFNGQPQRFQWVGQFINAMRDMHSINFIHGDLKPENLLVNQDGKIELSDFGKTKTMTENNTALHTGNARFAAPEGEISQKAEVFSSAMVIIRFLEEPFLKNNKTMLCDPKETKPITGSTSKLRGIEKFAVLNKECPQTNSMFMRLINIIKGNLISPYPKAEKEMVKYINALTDELIENIQNGKSLGNLTIVDVYKLRELLVRMTKSNPDKRLTMQEVAEEFQPILNKITGSPEEKKTP